MTDRIQQPGGDLPAGFELGAGGLVVPVGQAGIEHERWRHEDGMAIIRALRIAKAHGVRLIVGCDDNRCAEDPEIRQHVLPSGNVVWRCKHKERLLTGPPTKKSPWKRR